MTIQECFVAVFILGLTAAIATSINWYWKSKSIENDQENNA